MEYYLWIKVLHVFAVVAWMAGIFYLPRLFVYHASVQPNSDQAKLFSVMESRLLWQIMTPAMIVVWFSGVFLANILFQNGSFAQEKWFHVKLLCVMLMTLFHSFCALCCISFKSSCNRFSPRSYRLLNEIPTLLLLIIVTMVIVKPF